MYQSIAKLATLCTVLAILSAKSLEVRGEEQSVKRVSSDGRADESSCLCGFSKTILDKLEAIVQQATSAKQCSLEGGQKQDATPGATTATKPSTGHIQASNPGLDVSIQGRPTVSFDSSVKPGLELDARPSLNGTGASGLGGWSLGGASLPSKLGDEIQALQAQLSHLLTPGSSSGQSGTQSTPIASSSLTSSSSSSSSPSSSSSSWPPSFASSSSADTNSNPSFQLGGSSNYQTGGSGSGSGSVSGGSGGGAGAGAGAGLGLSSQFGGSISGGLPGWAQPSGSLSLQVSSQSNAGKPQAWTPNSSTNQNPTSSPFIQGLAVGSNQANQNEELNQSQNQNQNHKVEPQSVQQAVVSTVPSVVSNIFANIQEFAMQAEQNSINPAADSSSAPDSHQLTSIDGSSAQLNKNDTAAQITAQGEQLFVQWIEHQIQTYHMTASMAAYIRKSALNLFRRIVKQYVNRIERLGGAVESNVRQATQLALNNTQNLISYLLRNYLNVAGGLMRIMGEQVSRVGKQLDSTGDTIAHINLNPFDIVSNVIDSLPNPSRYSEYFRAFGKYLMGESGSHNEGSAQAEQTGSSVQENQSTERPRRGLLSKTVGAFSKTLGSWIG